MGQMNEELSRLTPVTGSFCHTVRAEIGLKGEKGADAFEFEVCSPEWLDAELDSYAIIHGGRMLITKRFDPTAVEEYVRKQLLHATGSKWEAIATKLSRWSRWEFENYNG